MTLSVGVFAADDSIVEQLAYVLADAGWVVAARATVLDEEPNVARQLPRWIGDEAIDVVVGTRTAASRAALIPLVTKRLLGFSDLRDVDGGRCDNTIVVLVPPTAELARAALAKALPRIEHEHARSGGRNAKVTIPPARTDRAFTPPPRIPSTPPPRIPSTPPPRIVATPPLRRVTTPPPRSGAMPPPQGTSAAPAPSDPATRTTGKPPRVPARATAKPPPTPLAARAAVLVIPPTAKADAAASQASEAHDARMPPSANADVAASSQIDANHVPVATAESQPANAVGTGSLASATSDASVSTPEPARANTAAAGPLASGGDDALVLTPEPRSANAAESGSVASGANDAPVPTPEPRSANAEAAASYEPGANDAPVPTPEPPRANAYPAGSAASLAPLPAAELASADAAASGSLASGANDDAAAALASAAEHAFAPMGELPASGPPKPPEALPASALTELAPADPPLPRWQLAPRARKRWLLAAGMALAGGIVTAVVVVVSSGSSRAPQPPAASAQNTGSSHSRSAVPDGSDAPASTTLDDPEPVHIDIDEPIEPTAASRSSGSAPRTATSPAVASKKPRATSAIVEAPVSADGCDKVSCVIDGYARACCEPFRPRRADELPRELDRSMIKAAMSKAKAAVIRCGEQHPANGIVRIALTVRGDGVVDEAAVSEAPDAALGACVASTVRKVTFAKTETGGSFAYPFKF